MNQETLQDALGLLDDDLITEVDQLRQQRACKHAPADFSAPEDLSAAVKKRRYHRALIHFGSLAAGLCVLIGVSHFLALSGAKTTEDSALNQEIFFNNSEKATGAAGDAAAEIEYQIETPSGQAETTSQDRETTSSSLSEDRLPTLLLLTAATEQSTGAAIPATKGGYHWTSDNGNGTLTSTIADAVHPLMCQDIMNSFRVTDPAITMKFTYAPDTPSQITIQCWSESYWGDTAAAAEFFASSESGLSLSDPTITLRDGTYIYLVTVQWEQGTVDYMFCATYERSTP